MGPLEGPHSALKDHLFRASVHRYIVTALYFLPFILSIPFMINGKTTHQETLKK